MKNSTTSPSGSKPSPRPRSRTQGDSRAHATICREALDDSIKHPRRDRLRRGGPSLDSRVRAGVSRFGAIPDESPAARISVDRDATTEPRVTTTPRSSSANCVARAKSATSAAAACRSALPSPASSNWSTQPIARSRASSMAGFDEVNELCFHCKLCYNHCPYTPPHEWDIDFPALDAPPSTISRRQRDGVSLARKVTTQTDLIGKIGSLAPAADECRQPQPAFARPDGKDARHSPRLDPTLVSPRDRQALVREKTGPTRGGERSRRSLHHLQRQLQRPRYRASRRRNPRAKRCARGSLLRALLRNAVHRYRRPRRRAPQRREERRRPAPLCRSRRHDRRARAFLLVDAEDRVSEIAGQRGTPSASPRAPRI